MSTNIKASMIERFRLFIEQQNLKVAQEKSVQDGIQISVTNGTDVAHCTFYTNGTIFARGKTSSLLEAIQAWTGRQKDEPEWSDLGWADFPASWREWDEDADWVQKYISNHGVPSEEEASDEYKIHREITFHDFMFRKQMSSEVSLNTLSFVIRSWLNRFCFMGLDVEELITDISARAQEWEGENTLPQISIGVAANTISLETCNYCSAKFIKQGDYWICPQVGSDQNGCASEIVNALYPYSTAGSVVAYTKSNLRKLLRRRFDVKWNDLSPTTPIEESMAKGLDMAGLLYIPQYQAHDDNHRYKIDYAIRTSNGPMIAIECDGLQFHARPETYVRDRIRDRYLQQRGFYIMRFSSNEIFNGLDKCVEEIDEAFWRIQRVKLTLKSPPRNSYFGVHE
jgi:hypothetical protein